MAGGAYTPRSYIDDTLIITNLYSRFIQRPTFEYFLDNLENLLAGDDCDGNYRSQLDGLDYLATSKVAEESIIPLLANVVGKFVADLEALARKDRGLASS
jgi:hypothetical protein